jgi:hypothetical protein
VCSIEGRDDQWCCACGAADGTVELRVGNPPRRGFRRRLDPAGEAWLREHGFVPVVDAWSLPATAAGEAWCAATLEAALAHALGADTAAPLEHVLTHPGVLEGADAPPADAPLEEHLGAALRALVRAGRGCYTAGSGRPEALRAFVWATDDALRVEREVPGVLESPGETWTEPLTPDGAARAAAELLRRVRAERPDADAEPWFLAYVAPDDGG